MNEINLDYFIKLLKNNIELIMKDSIIANGNYETLDSYDDLLKDSKWTYLFSVALYKTVKKYNSKYSKLFIVPENGGKTPSDFSIVDKNKNELIIEHENNPERIEKNFKKLITLNNSNAIKLLICYAYNKKDEIKINKLKSPNENIHILYGLGEIASKKDYYLIIR